MPISSNPTENGPVNQAGALFTGQGNLKRINPKIQALAAANASSVDYRTKDQAQTATLLHQLSVLIRNLPTESEVLRCHKFGVTTGESTSYSLAILQLNELYGESAWLHTL